MRICTVSHDEITELQQYSPKKSVVKLFAARTTHLQPERGDSRWRRWRALSLRADRPANAARNSSDD